MQSSTMPGFDYTLKSAENKALKSSGEIISLTLKGNTLNCWFLASLVIVIYSKDFTVMLQNKHMKNSIKESTSPSQK